MNLTVESEPQPILHLESDDFSFLKAYLPDAPAHGTKHARHPDSPETSSTCFSPIPDDEEEHHTEKRARRVPWTHTEDVAILALHRRHGHEWELIAAQLPGRTADAVRNRWHRLSKNHPMAVSEDGAQALDGLMMATHGISPPDSEAAVAAPVTVAAPNNSHGRQAWSPEEDKIITEGVARFGCKWREIAKSLPGRSDSSIRNRWERLQKDRFHARKAQNPPSSPSPALAAGGGLAAVPIDSPSADELPPAVPTVVHQPSPLGAESPFLMVDLDTFATLAFETLTDEQQQEILREPNSPNPVWRGVAAGQAAGAYAAAAYGAVAKPAPTMSVLDADVKQRPPANHAAPTKLKVASAFLAAFASLAIASTLARQRR